MFSKGDKVIYGTSGVCTVVDITTSPFGGGDLRVYYVLKPLDDNASVIYTPAEGGKIVVRAIISKEEALALIARKDEIGTITVPSEKLRRESYRQALASADPEQYISIIKTVDHRRKYAYRTHRQLAITDTEYERNAKYCLYNELSLVFGTTLEETEKMLALTEKKKQAAKEESEFDDEE